jgi:hypothetical protein
MFIMSCPVLMLVYNLMYFAYIEDSNVGANLVQIDGGGFLMLKNEVAMPANYTWTKLQCYKQVGNNWDFVYEEVVSGSGPGSSFRVFSPGSIEVGKVVRVKDIGAKQSPKGVWYKYSNPVTISSY